MSTNINIRVDSSLKKEAEKLFDNLGVTMSSAITMFLKRAVKEEAIPFRIEKNVYSNETINALLEYKNMKNKKKYKRYDSFKELLSEIKNA